MLLRNRDLDYRHRLGIGQLCLTLSVMLFIASGSLGNRSLLGLFVDPSRVVDFFDGFFTGLAAALLGLAVVMSASGLLELRAGRERE